MYLLSNHEKKISQHIQDSERIISRLLQIFEDINEKNEDFKNKLSIISIPDDFLLSKAILKILKEIDVISDIHEEDYSSTTITLRTIEDHSKEIIKDIKYPT